jgi:hypothetical protein
VNEFGIFIGWSNAIRPFDEREDIRLDHTSSRFIFILEKGRGLDWALEFLVDFGVMEFFLGSFWFEGF